MSRHLLVAVLLLGILADRAAATLTYDSFVAAADVNAEYFTGAARSPYSSFSTGNDAVQLTDVRLRLEVYDQASGSALVGLYYDSAGAPGDLCASLATINDADLALYPSWQEYHVTPSGITLAPNTRYWIGLTTSDDGSVAWLSQMLNTLDGTTGVVGEYHGQGEWSAFYENETGEGSPPQMQLETAVVPEPATLLLLGVGLGMATLRRRRR